MLRSGLDVDGYILVVDDICLHSFAIKISGRKLDLVCPESDTDAESSPLPSWRAVLVIIEERVSASCKVVQFKFKFY